MTIPEPAVTRVAGVLRAAIDDGTLLPGEHVRQELWAERLGTSRVPIREALRTLTSEGLVRHDPNRGYFVLRIELTELAQIYRLRQLIEPEILRSSAPIDDDRLETLRAIALGAEELLRRGDIAGAFERERQLHFSIWRSSPLQLMVGEARRLWGLCDAWRIKTARMYPDLDAYADLLGQRHAQILDALQHHEPEKLAQIIYEDRQTLLDLTRQSHPVAALPTLRPDVIELNNCNEDTSHG